MPNNFDDYCDLDPTKLCDNCCKCLESSEDYKLVLADFTEEEMAEEQVEDEEVVFDGSSVPMPEIDPQLQAKWEQILAQDDFTRLPAEPQLKHDAGLHGVRKRKAHAHRARLDDYNG